MRAAFSERCAAAEVAASSNAIPLTPPRTAHQQHERRARSLQQSAHDGARQSTSWSANASITAIANRLITDFLLRHRSIGHCFFIFEAHSRLE